MRSVALAGLLCLVSAQQLLADQSVSPALAEALQAGDVNALFSLLDHDALTARAGLDAGLAPVVARARDLLLTPRISSCRLYQSADGTWLLRLDLLPEGLNYLALQFRDLQADRPLVDWHDHALGISLSQLLSGIASLGETRSGRVFLQKLNDQPLKAWQSLSDRQQRERVPATLLLAACGAQSCHAEALRTLSTLVADGQPAALWQLDAAALAQDHESFQRALASLEQQLGDDAGLAWLRVAQLLREQRCEKQAASVVQHTEAWPDYLPLQTAAAQCLVSAGAHAEAVKVFHRLVHEFGLQPDWNAMASDPFYRAFIASPPLQAWAQQQTP